MSRSLSRLAFPALLAGNALTIMDVSLVAIATPTVAKGLDLGPLQAAFVAGIYLLGFAALMLPFGRLGDLLGRRTVFTAGAAAFLAGALLSAAAPTYGALVAARLVQGAGAAALAPQAMAMVPLLFEPERRPLAFRRYAMAMALASIGSPLVAGLVLSLAGDTLGWRAIFLAEAALAGTILLLSLAALPPGGGNGAGRPGLGEVASFAMVGAAAILPLYLSPPGGWNAALLALALALLGALLLLFGLVERRRLRAGREVLVPAAVLADRSFRVGALVVALAISTPAGLFLVLSLALQDGAALSPFRMGLTLAPMPVGVLLATLLLARVSPDAPLRRISLGAALIALGFALLVIVLTLVEQRVALAVMPTLLVSGLGMGLAAPAVFQLALATVPPAATGSASGLLQTGQQIGLAVSIAISGALYGWWIAAPAALGPVQAAAATAPYQIAVLLLVAALTAILARRAERAAACPPAPQREAAAGACEFSHASARKNR